MRPRDSMPTVVEMRDMFAYVVAFTTMRWKRLTSEERARVAGLYADILQIVHPVTAKVISITHRRRR